MRQDQLIVATTAVAIALAGCSGVEQTETAPVDTTASTLDPAYEGPRVTDTSDEPATTETEQVVQSIAATPEVPPSSSELPTRSDGRPQWWFDGVVAAGSSVETCAEALAADVHEARRKAVDAGRASLRAALGGSDFDDDLMRIIKTTIVPLPDSQGGEYRYAAYVHVEFDSSGL